jgi:hypothetical protein
MKAFACILVAVLAMAWPPSSAVALDITFDDVTSVGNPLRSVLDTHGYRFAGSFRTIDAPGTALVSNRSPVYLGQEASATDLTLTRSDGGAFALYELDAAGLAIKASATAPNAGQLTLLGQRIGGGLLHASYALSEIPSFAHFAVPGSWYELQAVTFAGLLAGGEPGAFALDDVGVGQGPASVAEPATLTLALLTALGGGVMALTRRRRHGAFRPR